VTRTVGREHHRALELLERALGYTRGALATVGADRSGPTPCAGWSLADLLCHMDDGLDAFLDKIIMERFAVFDDAHASFRSVRANRPQARRCPF